MQKNHIKHNREKERSRNKLEKREKQNKEKEKSSMKKVFPKKEVTPIGEVKLPSEVKIKLLSVQGEELTGEIATSIHTSRSFLNDLLNKFKKLEEPRSYIFRIDEAEIKESIQETLLKKGNFQSEKTINIVYHPESEFSVAPLTRASSTLEGHTDSILTAVFSPNSKNLASGGGDSTVRFWDLDTETPLHTCELHNNWVLTLAWAHDNEKLASGSVDGTFVLWDPNTGNNITSKIKAHNQYITSMAWKPMHLDKDCKYMLTASKDGLVKIWNAPMESCALTFSAHNEAITKVIIKLIFKAIWSGENFIYTSSRDKMIKVWTEEGILMHALTGHAHWVNTMTLNTEFVLKTACFDEKKKEFKDKIEMQAYALERYKNLKESMSSGDQFEKLVSGSDDFTLILWDPLKTSKQINRLTGHQNLINQVQFSPDTYYLASASFDNSIKIWNGHTGIFLFNLRGHVGPVYQIAWSGDSRMIVSGSKDSTLKCWNVKAKRLMFDLPGHADEVRLKI